MEKTINIDGRPVTFKATGGVMYRYKAQFGRELLTDLAELEEYTNSAVEVNTRQKRPDGKIEIKKVTVYDKTKLNLESLYNILWIYAKTADESIPDPQAWLDTFDKFPVYDIYEQLQEITGANFTVDRKNV